MHKDGNKVNSNLVDISEFLTTSLLSERDLVLLLAKGELEFCQGEHGELLIDLTNTDPRQLAQANLNSDFEEQHKDLGMEHEVIASLLVSSLDEIIDQALQMAVGWISAERVKSSTKPQ